MPTQIVLTRLRSFEKAREWLREARDAEFKSGRGVRVVNERYNGYGLVVTDDGCPIDQVAVRLENGNTWWYPLEDCSLANRDTCPQWLKDQIRIESKSVLRRLTAQRTAI